MQLAVAAAKLLLLEEEGVVHERQGVEDVEARLLGQHERVVDEAVEPRLERGPVRRLGQARLGGVVEEVGDAQRAVLRVVDDGRLDAEEGEEVGDFLVGVLQMWSVL